MLGDTTLQFFSGAITLGYMVAGLFFVGFWTRTKEMLFLVFGLAFWLLALNQAALSLSGIPREEQSWIYLIRLAAFALIIAAIVQKNLKSPPRP